MKTSIIVNGCRHHIERGDTTVGSNDKDGSWVSEKYHTLHQRIPKTHAERRHDPFSPVACLNFGEKGDLRVWVKGLESMFIERAYKLGGYLDPYTNSVLCNLPQLSIEGDTLPSSSELSYETGILGDFLFISERWPHGPDGMTVFCVNISAIGLFAGLSHITMQGELRFMQHPIGYLNSHTSMIAERMRIKPDATHILKQWRERSFERCRRFIDPYAKSRDKTVFGFDDILCEVMRDRGCISEEEGVKRAKELCQIVFP